MHSWANIIIWVVFTGILVNAMQKQLFYHVSFGVPWRYFLLQRIIHKNDMILESVSITVWYIDRNNPRKDSNLLLLCVCSYCRIICILN